MPFTPCLKRKPLFAVLIPLITLFFQPATATKVDAAVTLRVGVESDFNGFDPLRTRLMGLSTLTAAVTMFDTLVTLDEAGNVQPRLASDVRLSEDERRWTLRLREDVRFHDGTPFDAAAVAFHFTRLLAPENRCACRSLLAPIERVEASATYEVVIHLRQPWAALPAILGEPSVVSLIGSPTAIGKSADDYHRAPVGTGPYVFERWLPGDRLVVTRNPAHFDGEAVHLDRIEFRVLPDSQARFSSVRSGDVDVAWTLHAGSAQRAEKDPALAVRRHVGAGARVLVLNTRSGALSDRRVRQALALASNAQLYAQATSDGLVPAATNPYGPSSPFQCDGVPFPGGDAAGARRLLEEYGEPVQLQYLHTATPRGQAAGQIFQQFWAQAGFEVELVPLEQVQLVRRVLKGDYDIGPWRLRDSMDPDPDLFALFFSESAFNVTGLQSPELDALLIRGRATMDRETRGEAYCAIARLIADEVPLLYLASNTYFAIANDRLAELPPLRGGILDVRWSKLTR